MSLARTILRWRARQRREVWRSLWMHGPFTAVQARQVCQRINYSPMKAANLIRSHEKDLRAIERTKSVELAALVAQNRGQDTRATFCELFGVVDFNDLLEHPAAATRARRMEIMRARSRTAVDEAVGLMREAHA